ncbi:rhomboid family intramembrane serine protease [Haloferax larsenii]|nr:rhomboid family intramembrane serine protease [Haloferax larsenii]ELZ79129.1 rhomboid family protein [Haloferax larsenii JCM 13917]
MDNTVSRRVESALDKYVVSMPATAALVALFWIVHLLKVGVFQFYSSDLALTLFYIRSTHLDYVWTWVTATVGHVNLLHLVVNSYFAFLIGGWAESTVRTRRYLGVFVVGGSLTALLGTIVSAAAYGYLIVDLGPIADVSSSSPTWVVAGSSMGWLAVLGMLLALDLNGRVYLWKFKPRRWVWFVALFVLSLAGTVSDVWLLGVTIGHPYHMVGLVLGGLYGLFVASD